MKKLTLLLAALFAFSVTAFAADLAEETHEEAHKATKHHKVKKDGTHESESETVVTKEGKKEENGKTVKESKMKDKHLHEEETKNAEAAE